MTHEQRERLSALADDAAKPAQAAVLLAEVEQSPDLRACWQRYHLIGNVLRGETVSAPHCAIGDSVRARLASEASPVRRGFAARLRGWLARINRRPSLMLPAYGGAAAVALSLSFVSLGLLAPEGSVDPSLGRQVAAVDSPSTEGGPVSAAALSEADLGPRWQATSPALSSKLDRMLVGHREGASMSGIKGFIPYATVVGNGLR